LGTRNLKTTLWEEPMWWGIGFGGLLYFVLLVTLGIMTLRNGHGWLFFFGIFLPFLWIVGALMRPASRLA
jgi:hypothetical protein